MCLHFCQREKGGGYTQSINVGNNCGTSRPPLFGFHRLQNWPMYIHRSNFWLVFQKCLLQKVAKVEKIVPNVVLGSILKLLIAIQLFCSN